MANRVEPRLLPPLFESLQNEQFITLATIDHETGGPNVNALSWVFAPDEGRILLAVDNRSKILHNIRNNSHVVVSIIANESTYAVSGEGSIKVESVENVPLKLAIIEINISEVRDVMFYGSKIFLEPRYEKTYDLQAAAKLDNQVMTALKNCTE